MSDTDGVVPYIYTGDGITIINFTEMACKPEISSLRKMFTDYYTSLSDTADYANYSEFPLVKGMQRVVNWYSKTVNRVIPDNSFDLILNNCFSKTYLGLALVDQSYQSGKTRTVLKGFVVAGINGEEQSATILYGYIGNGFSIEEGFKKLIKSLKLELSNNDITNLKAFSPRISTNYPGILTVETLMNNGFSIAADGSLVSSTRQNTNGKQI